MTELRKNTNPVSVPKQYMNGFKREQMQDVFSEIYQKNFWAHAEGSGSDSRPEIVPEYFNVLTNILDEYKVKTVSDLGCGTFYIFKDYVWPDDVSYTGYDVSDIALEKAVKNCSRKDFKFQHIKDYSEIEPSNLLIVKDVICHWPKDLVIDFVNNFLPKFDNAIIVGNPKINMFDEIATYKREWLFKNEKGHEYGVWMY